MEQYKKGLQSISKVINTKASGKQEYDVKLPDEFGKLVLRIPDSLWEFLTDSQIRTIIEKTDN